MKISKIAKLCKDAKLVCMTSTETRLRRRIRKRP